MISDFQFIEPIRYIRFDSVFYYIYNIEYFSRYV